MSTVALLPMKAHSSRVKNKNFRLFAGKPLFQWILDTLVNLEEIDQVVINTDAREELRLQGLEESDRVMIRDRIPELCGDEVSMNLVIGNDVENVSADTYLMTHTTNPLLSGATVQNALARFDEGHKKKEGDSLFTVNRHQTRFYRGSGEPVNHDPNNLIPTQDLEPWYEENSCLYLFTRDSFKRTRARIGECPLFFETPALESVDIDTEVEWHHAEVLALSRLMFESHASFSI